MTHAEIEGKLGAAALARGSEILGKGIGSLVARDAPHAPTVLTVPIGAFKNKYLVDGAASASAYLQQIGKKVKRADHVTCVLFCFVLLFRFSPMATQSLN